MKVLTLLLVFIIWLIILLIIRIRLNVSYRLEGISSIARFDFRLFLFRVRINLSVPKEMLTNGIMNILLNISESSTDDGSENTNEDCKRFDQHKIKSRRFRFMIDFSRGVMHHYVYSWSNVLYLKRSFQKLVQRFFRKIEIYRFHVKVDVGTNDAANTALLTGLIWSVFGHLKSRLYRSVTIKKDNIIYGVVPNFQEEMFLCKLNCILSLKISHIIFTAYKFLLVMVKLRRTRNYG